MDCTSTGNDLLDIVLRGDKETAAPFIREASRCDFVQGKKFQRAGEVIDTCYFPATGALSLICRPEAETQVTTMTMGFDGAVHATLGTDFTAASHDVVSRLPGSLWKINASRWQVLMRESAWTRQVTGIFTDFLLARAQRALACERRHDAESRFCRALLELHRWQHGRPLSVTHQELSQLLGVRRTTVTLLARALQEADIISYQRGTIEIVDPYALQQASCTCHDLPHQWTALCRAGSAFVPNETQTGRHRATS